MQSDTSYRHMKGPSGINSDLLQSVHSHLPRSKKMDTKRPRFTFSQVDNTGWKSVSSPRVLVKKSQGRLWLVRLYHVTISIAKGAGQPQLNHTSGSSPRKEGIFHQKKSPPTIEVINIIILFTDLLPLDISSFLLLRKMRNWYTLLSSISPFPYWIL